MSIGAKGWRIIHLNNHGVKSSSIIRLNFFNDRIHMMCEKELGKGQRHHKGEGVIKLSI